MDAVQAINKHLRDAVAASLSRYEKALADVEILYEESTDSSPIMLSFDDIYKKVALPHFKMDKLMHYLPRLSARAKSKKRTYITVQGSGPMTESMNTALKSQQDQQYTLITLCQLFQLHATLTQRKAALASFEEKLLELPATSTLDPLRSLPNENKDFFEKRVEKAQVDVHIAKLLQETPRATFKKLPSKTGIPTPRFPGRKYQPGKITPTPHKDGPLRSTRKTTPATTPTRTSSRSSRPRPRGKGGKTCSRVWFSL